MFTVLDWIATLIAHISNKGKQLVRYYGYYSNVSRGKRKKEKPEEQEIIALDPQPVSKELKKRWAYVIRKVYEADPLTCPKCQRDLETRLPSLIGALGSRTPVGTGPSGQFRVLSGWPLKGNSYH